jgi:hypothetical protein
MLSAYIDVLGYEKCRQNFSCKPDRMRPHGRPRCKWENNIKTDLKEIRFLDVN